MRFDLFSKRNKTLPDVYQYTNLPPEFRTQVIWIWTDTIFKYNSIKGFENVTVNPLLHAVRKAVCTEHGRRCLTKNNHSAIDDVLDFVQDSKDALIVLDVIEMAFSVLGSVVQNEDGYGKVDRPTLAQAIRTLNHRFREHGIGYEFNADSLTLIRIDETAIHENAVRPALSVLTGKGYKHANDEMLEAFDDYKKGDYDDCPVKCCAAMESVLKIIHHRKKWKLLDGSGDELPTSIEKATAAPLVTSYIQNSGLPSFYAQPLTIIATLRNQKSSAHGAGVHAKSVPEHFAKYALNATTSAILLLHEHAK